MCEAVRHGVGVAMHRVIRLMQGYRAGSAGPSASVGTARRVAANPWTYWLLSRGAFVVLLRSVRRFGGTSVLGDVRGVYFPAAQHMAHGLVPYLDFRYEYPPGSLPFVLLGWVLGGHRPGTYTAGWMLMMLALDAVALASLLRLAGPANARIAAAVWLVGGATMFWSCLRNDMIAVAAVVAALALLARRPAAAGASWAFGTVVKLWPGPPMVAIAIARSRGRTRFVVGALIVSVVSVVSVAVPGALRAMLSYLDAYQGHRPIECESTWADIRWLHAAYDGTALRTRFIDGSRSFVDGWSSDFARLGYDLTTAVSALLVVIAVALHWRGRREISLRTWVWLLECYLLATLLVAPVFSAQYGLWFVATGAAVAAVDRTRIGLAVSVSTVIAGALTTVIYPFGFQALLVGRGWVVAVLTARTLLLVMMLVLSLRGAARAARDAPEPTVRTRPSAFA